MAMKLLQGVLLAACTVVVGVVIHMFYAMGEVTVAKLRREKEAITVAPVAAVIDTRKPRTQQPGVRDIRIPGSALTVAQGWSTTCTVTFIDGTTQVAVVSLAP